MKKLLTWTIVHISIWALLYGAFEEGIEGALNTLKFIVWCVAFLTPILLSDIAINKTAEQPATPIRKTLSNIQSWVILLLLVWNGHIFTAVAWSFAMFVTTMHQDQVEKRRVEMHQPERKAA